MELGYNMKKVIRASAQVAKIEFAYIRVTKIYKEHKALIDRLKNK